MKRTLLCISAAATVVCTAAGNAAAEQKQKGKTSNYLQFEMKGALVTKVPSAGASTQKGSIAGSAAKQRQGKTTTTDDWSEPQ